MPITIIKKPPLAEPAPLAVATSLPTPAQVAAHQAQQAAPKKPSWLKSGAAAQEEIAKAEAAAAARREANEKMRAFYLKTGETKTLTFLDGDLDESGLLDVMTIDVHHVQTGPKMWDDFTCVAADEICPLCNAQNKAYLSGLLTVINHTPYTIQSGAKAGTTLGPRRELYKPGLGTLRLLQTLATKWGGLRGWKVEVSRASDNDSRQGNLFEKIDRVDDTVAVYGELGHPADYETEVPYFNAAELVAMKLGVAPTGPGFQNKGVSVGAASEYM